MKNLDETTSCILVQSRTAIWETDKVDPPLRITRQAQYKKKKNCIVLDARSIQLNR